MAKILIADDDPVMVKLFEFSFRKAGHELIVCREGMSVPERARAESPDVAIFDLMLPGLSGLELIRLFKGEDGLRDIPILVVTGQGRDSTRDELQEAGAASVFTKPFSPSVLLARIEELNAPGR